MKYLIRIINNKASIYKVDKVGELISKSVHGEEMYSFETGSWKELWGWIIDTAGCTESNPLDLCMLVKESPSLEQEWFSFRRGGFEKKNVVSKEWKESELYGIIETIFKVNADELHFDKEKSSFLDKKGTNSIQALGVSDSFQIIADGKKIAKLKSKEQRRGHSRVLPRNGYKVEKRSFSAGVKTEKGISKNLQGTDKQELMKDGLLPATNEEKKEYITRHLNES